MFKPHAVPSDRGRVVLQSQKKGKKAAWTVTANIRVCVVCPPKRIFSGWLVDVSIYLG